jgi:hypothetical protein
VRHQLDSLEERRWTAEIRRLRADAAGRSGTAETARRLYRCARADLPHYAHEARTRLALRTAVADRPAVLRVLSGGTPAVQQARLLDSLSRGAGGPVKAWAAVRFLDAHRYARADSLWRRADPSLPAPLPRSWRQGYAIQKGGWAAEAAVRAGRPVVGRRRARRAARRARARGAVDWARALGTWARRAAPDLGARVAPEPQARGSVHPP